MNGARVVSGSMLVRRDTPPAYAVHRLERTVGRLPDAQRLDVGRGWDQARGKAQDFLVGIWWERDHLTGGVRVFFPVLEEGKA